MILLLINISWPLHIIRTNEHKEKCKKACTGKIILNKKVTRESEKKRLSTQGGDEEFQEGLRAGWGQADCFKKQACDSTEGQGHP